jgi:putative oxidoreductase
MAPLAYAQMMQQVASLHLPVTAFFLVVTGVFEGAGGVALVLGVYARVAAGALALFTAFVSFVFVRFWSFKGPPEIRTMIRNTFVGNVAITGGLIYLAVLGPGGLALTDL